MSPKFKRFFIAELLALLFALIPLALMYYVQSLGEDPGSEELYIFYAGLNAFMAYPALAVITPVILAMCRFESYIACMPVPIGFILGNITFIQLPIIDSVVYALIYAAVGLGLAALIARIKRRQETDRRVLGRR